MDSFEAPRLLSEKEAHAKVLGYCSVPDSDQILMTHESKVVLMQPYSGKLIQSWTCPGSKGHKFTGSTIFSEEDQEFVVIQNKKTLRTIKLQDFNETETFTVRYPIHCITSRPGMSPVVIFEDGTIYCLDDVLEDPKNVKLQRKIPLKIKEILCVEMTTMDNGSLLVLIVCRDKKESLKVLAGIIAPDSHKVKYFYTPIKKKDHIVSVCALHGHSIPTFSVLWSDQSLMKLSVFVSLKTMNVELDNVTTIKGSTKKYQIAAISQDQLLILSPGRYIECVDMTFGSTLQTLDVDADVNQIFVLDDLILLDSPNRIQKIKFKAEPITLAQAILKSNRSDTLCFPDHVKWDSPPTQKTSLFTDEDTSLIQRLIEINNSDAFIKHWKDLWTKDRSSDFKKEFCHSEAMKKILSKLGLEDDKKNFWPGKVLRQIVRTGFIHGRWCHGLITKVLDKADWDFLYSCVLHINDIPESLIVQCITKFFNGKPIICNSNGDTEDLENCVQLHCDVPEIVLSIMRRILELKCTETALRDELAAMPFQAAQNFILYLTELLTKSNLSSRQPSLDQVINWLNLVLDSHISEIIMLENSWPMIQQLQRAVDVLGKIFDDLGVVSNLLTRMKCELPDCVKERSLYTVEIMRLGF